MNLNLSQDDKDRLVGILARQAATSFPGQPERYFIDLARSGNVPHDWWIGLSGGWTGRPAADARSFIEWAIARDVNPEDMRFTTLASVLTPMLDDLGRQAATAVVAVILGYELYLDEALVIALRRRYAVPDAMRTSAQEAPEPIIDVSEDDVQLQSWLKHEPPWLDVGFLMKAMERASVVCRVETSNRTPVGSGVYVADDLVLTNWHVFNALPGGDDQSKLNEARLHFGAISGATDDRRVMSLAPGDGVVSSPFEALDFALLRLPKGPKARPARLPLSLPRSRNSITRAWAQACTFFSTPTAKP